MHRGPLPAPKTLSPLEQHWEDVLAAEGMPAEIRPLTASSAADPAKRDGLVVVSLAPELAEQAALDAELPANVADTDTARHWRAFSAAIWRLPKRWNPQHVAFLHAYAEHGFLTRAARETGLSRQNARSALKAFEHWRAGQC